MKNKIFLSKLERKAGQEEREVCMRQGRKTGDFTKASTFKGDRVKEPRRSRRKL